MTRQPLTAQTHDTSTIYGTPTRNGNHSQSQHSQMTRQPLSHTSCGTATQTHDTSTTYSTATCHVMRQPFTTKRYDTETIQITTQPHDTSPIHKQHRKQCFITSQHRLLQSTAEWGHRLGNTERHQAVDVHGGVYMY